MAVSPLEPGIERALRVPDLDGKMAGKKAVELSPESVARANRHRLTLEEGARAMLDFEQKAIAVRKNMERLRALREAKEAQEASTQATLPDTPKKKRKKALSR
jgi:hypothetical protein